MVRTVIDEVRQAVQLAPRDAEFIFNEAPGHRSQLMAIYFFDATGEAAPTRDQVIGWMRQRLPVADLFTRRLQQVPLAVGYPYWVPHAPDLDRHVHTAVADRPGWAGVDGYLAPVLTRPMDLTAPPWELHVLSGVTDVPGLPAELTVVALKVHHSAADGLMVRDITLDLFGGGSAKTVEGGPPAPRPGAEEPGAAQPVAAGLATAGLAVRAVVGLPGSLLRFRQGMQATKPAEARIKAAEETGELATVPGRANTRVNVPADTAASIRRVRFDRDGVRAVRSAVLAATINDVYLAVVGRALALYLAEIGDEPDGELVAMVPRSVRGILSWDSANMLELLKVATGSDIAEPLARVAHVTAAAQDAKDRADAPDVRLLNTRIETSPAPLLALVGRMRRLDRVAPDGRRQSHTMISNIPLAVDGCGFFGAPAVLALGTQPPVDGDGARHFLTAAAGGGFELAVVSGGNAIPDADRYAELLTATFAEMVAAVERA